MQMNCRRGLTVELRCREGEVEQSARKTCNTPVIEWLPTRVPLTTWHDLAELLGKCDDDALRSADVG